MFFGSISWIIKTKADTSSIEKVRLALALYFLEWHYRLAKFQDKKFWNQTKCQVFKINISWSKFCLFLIEKAHIIYELDIEQNIDDGIEQTQEKLTHDDNKRVIEEQGEKVLKPIFASITKAENIPTRSLLQIVEIYPTNESLFTINLSDSEYWISSKLNKSFSDRISQGHIKRLEVIQVKDCTGDLNSGFIDIDKICRPKSLQVDNPVVFLIQFHLSPLWSIHKTLMKVPRQILL